MDPLRNRELVLVAGDSLAPQRHLLAQWRLRRDRRRRSWPRAEPPHHEPTVARSLHRCLLRGERAVTNVEEIERANSHGRDHDARIEVVRGWCVGAIVRAPARRFAVRAVRAAARPADVNWSARSRRPAGAADPARRICWQTRSVRSSSELEPFSRCPSSIRTATPSSPWTLLSEASATPHAPWRAGVSERRPSSSASGQC